VILVQAEGGEERFVFHRGFVIGKDIACGLRLQGDPYVSIFHAKVLQDGGAWVIEDLGSTNGTWVNAGGTPAAWRRVRARAPLYMGDQVRIGHTVLTVVMD
jgi:adenylate cyclase